MIHIIGRRLSESRDVRGIWSQMAPELAYGRHFGPPPPDARQAAVLALLYFDKGRWWLPLIERVVDTTVHSGQIGFPGGSLELNETPEQAALREFEEELGSPVDRFHICGRLTPTYIYASNYLVTPCVAVAPEPPLLSASAHEVASILIVPLDELSSEARRGTHVVQRRGLTFRASHMTFHGYYVWGATSMILAELAACLKDELN